MKGLMQKTRAILMMALMLGLSAYAIADTTNITVTFTIPVAVSHSVAYAASCSVSDFAFIETGTIDGNDKGINATQIDGTACQSDESPALNISNTGNVAINITMNITLALPTGVEVKASQVTYATGWEDTCSNTEPPATGCIDVVAGTPKKIAANVAVSEWQDIWTWSDFASADLGSGAGNADTDTRVLRIMASQA